MAVYIIAELGMSHDGSLGTAGALLAEAVACGADAVKFQTHVASAETLPDAPMPPYFKDEPRYAYFERTAFTREQWETLQRRAQAAGVDFLSSAFSIEAVELLEAIGVVRYKIPSGEVTNLPYLEAVAATGKPVLLSSGMSSWPELDAAVNVFARRQVDLTIMQCTSEYPCPYEHVGLNVLGELRQRYRVPVGLSDHTLTNYASFAAVVLGATVIEKHFVLSRRMYGSDAKHSLEPAEFADLVRGIRATEMMIGSPIDKNDIARFAEMKTIFQKSVVAVVDIVPGAVITSEMLGQKKPGTGMPPARVHEVVGRRAARPVKAGSMLAEADVAWD